jgi:hypothetical protein
MSGIANLNTRDLGAANGAASLDGSSVNAQAPKIHGQAHGRGGTDTMLNGLEISDTTASQSDHTFLLGPRTNTGLAFPVATFQPKTAARVQSVDIAPSVGATESSGNGQCWLDWCSAPVIDATTFNANSMRVAMRGSQATPTFGEITTRTFGTNGSIPIGIAANYSGSGTYQIQITPIGGIAPSIILGQDGSDVLIGTLSDVAAAATKGFLYIGKTASGGPTGVPHYAANGAAVLVSQTATPSLNVYVNGAWWHVALTTGAA